MTHGNTLVWHPNENEWCYDNQLRVCEVLENFDNLVILNTSTKFDVDKMAKAFKSPIAELKDNEANRNKTFSELLEDVKAMLDEHDISQVMTFYTPENACYYDECAFTDMHREFIFNDCTFADVVERENPIRQHTFWNFCIQMIMIDECYLRNKIIVSDPLQFKFKHYTYNQNLVELYYSHLFTHTRKADCIYAATPDSRNQMTSVFKFSNSEEYTYAKQINFDLAALQKENIYKHKTFVFGMNRGWTESSIKHRDAIVDALLTLPDTAEYDIAIRQTSRMPKRNDIPARYDKFVSYNEYQELIKDAKTTLVVASFDTRFFSLRRFFESIIHKTLPLLDVNSNYQAGFNYDDEFLAVVDKYLVVDASDAKELQQKIDDVCDNHDLIIAELFNTKNMQQYFNKQWYIDNMKTILTS